MTKNTIAIDFGTTNTYVSLCAADSKNVQGIQFDGVHPETPTEILYSDKPNADKNVFPIIGKKASETYKEWDTDERVENQCRYRAIFKPDIVKSADAKKCAVDFLKSLLRDAKKNNAPLNPLDQRVFFGVPAEANEEYRRTLQQIANEAGFGSVELVEEPKGAMLSDLGLGTMISLADMLQGYLVIDFGGGTCDFAFFQNGVIKHSWGDMHLGGRLLDDLFWQWFSEENPDIAEDFIQTGEEFYCRTVQCRETKEWFSETINGDPNYNGKKKVGDTGGRISNLSKTEFEHRARNFMPSQLFLDFQKETGVEMPERLTNGKPFDFIQWFMDCTLQGLREGGITPQDIAVVSLAGGSSRWYFVADYCKKMLELDEKHIVQNSEPYAAISKGIAMLPAIEKEFADKKERITNEKSDFINKEILSHARNSFERCGKLIADEIIVSLFDKKIKPLLLTFRSNGGTVSALEKDIAAVAAAYQPQLEQFAEKTLSEELTGMFNTAQEKLSKWLEEKFKLRLSERQQEIRVDGPKLPKTNMDIIGGVVTTIKIIVGGIVSFVVASICGGGGMALIASGPLGWIIGLIIAIVAVTAALDGISGKDIPISSWMLFPILTDAKISSVREKMHTDIKDSVRKAGDEAHGKIESALDNLIQQVVDRLSIVNVT